MHYTGTSLDPARDARHLTNSDSARNLMAADVGAVAEYANQGRPLYGYQWADWARARGWHPRWAAEAARRYGLWLASCACPDPEAARQQAIGRWQEQLERLQRQDLGKVPGVVGGIAECLRQLDALQGVPERAKAAAISVSLNLSGKVDAHTLSTYTDEQLKAKLAELVSVRDDEGEQGEGGGGGKGGHLGGGSTDGSLSRDSDIGTPSSPNPLPCLEDGTTFDKPIKPLDRSLTPAHVLRAAETTFKPRDLGVSDIPPPPVKVKTGPLSEAGGSSVVGTKKLGICPGCGVEIKAGKSLVQDRGGMAWHERCFDRYIR